MRRIRLRVTHLLFAAALVLTIAGMIVLTNNHTVQASSSYLTAARAQYPNIVGTALDGCILCHPSGGYSLNPYASDFASNGHSFTAIASLDSDKDGYTNLAEIQALTFPGDAASRPGAATATATRTRTPAPPSATPTRTNTPPSGASPTATSTRTSVPPASSPTPIPPATHTPAPTATARPSLARAAFVGSVTRLPSTRGRVGDWTVQGHVIHVTTATWIENSGLLGNGAQVWVLGTRRSDGSVNATYVRVLQGGSGGDD